ncbi:MAG: peptide chain release factor N(5)-glutamine methyltransferase [bacterium]|nr:peptide chain release factor N(5)-glutamine methyltransferase [bacterium]
MATIATALADARQRLAAVSTSASLDAQLLLAHVLAVSRAHIIAHPEKSLSPIQVEAFEQLLRRREQGEPVSYLFGRREWYDREMIVSPAVLIPRPETELLLEDALAFAQARRGESAAQMLTAVDVGTGSGALAVTFKALTQTAIVYAVDLSTDALEVARRNAEAQQAEVHFLQGDLLLPLIERDIRVDLVMANLPYIPTEEVPTLEVSRFEPHLALDGGADGLVLVRRLLAQLPQVIQPGALALLEIGAGQGEAALEAVYQTLRPQRLLRPLQAFVRRDYAGHDRILTLRF